MYHQQQGPSPGITLQPPHPQLQRQLLHQPDLPPTRGGVLRRSGFELFENPPPASRVYHSVDTADAVPLHCKVRPLLGEKLTAAKAAFAEMEAAGVICCSNSPWSSLLHMVRKKNSGWRPRGNYRRLNQITVPDRYPIPLISNAQASLRGVQSV